MSLVSWETAAIVTYHGPEDTVTRLRGVSPTHQVALIFIRNYVECRYNRRFRLLYAVFHFVFGTLNTSF